MEHKTVTALVRPAAVGPYCSCQTVWRYLYCSGQLGPYPRNRRQPEGVEAQAKQGPWTT